MTQADVELVGFRPELRSHFERLNRVWLEAHSLLEPADVEYLQNPETHILAPGGEVFFAVRGDEVSARARPFLQRARRGSWRS